MAIDRIEAARVTARPLPRPRRSRDPLVLVTESALVGRYGGWDGATEFRLANGQVWKQSAWRCRSVELRGAAVRLWKLGEQHLIEIEGTYEILPVHRLEPQA